MKPKQQHPAAPAPHSIHAPSAPPLAAAGDTFQTLLARAEAARAANALADGLEAASAACAVAATAEQRRSSGLLLAHFQYRSGALQPLIATGLAVLPLLRGDASTPPTELFDFLRLLALAGCDVGCFDVALPLAHEAQRLALQIGDAGRVALAINAVACCFERMGDPWQAERMMLDALDIARQHGQERPLFVTLNNLSAVLIGMFHQLRDTTPAPSGRHDGLPADEALAALRRALPLARESHAMSLQQDERFFRLFASGNYGEVLLHLRQPDDARPLLEAALALAHELGSGAQAARIGCSMGELQLFEGDAEASWQTLEAARLAAAGTDLQATQLRLHHGLWRAARVLQRPEAALQHLEAYLQLERRRAVSQLRAQSELFVTRAEAEQARLEARRDQLTHLGNRREVEHRWPQLLQDAAVSSAPLAVVMLDLDRFKQINDNHGHAIGDGVLVALAGLLRENTRSADIVARIGGEEFLLVLPDTGAERALEVCERVRDRVSSHRWNALAPGLAVTLSAGIASAPPYDAHVLSARADNALYRAKSDGRNRVVVG